LHKIPQLTVDLSEKTIHSFLNILATDYAGFRKRDQAVNQEGDPRFTKNRYNPLFEYPIIETDLEGLGRGYIVPNVVGYLLKAFGGLFWWFHTYYEKQGKDPLVEFRTPFGKVFEQYVGILLKDIYGEKYVGGEILSLCRFSSVLPSLQDKDRLETTSDDAVYHASRPQPVGRRAGSMISFFMQAGITPLASSVVCLAGQTSPRVQTVPSTFAASSEPASVDLAAAAG
jgi:hypothetical protein